MARLLVAVLLLAYPLVWSPGWAATPVDVYEFADAEQQARYRALLDEFRCPKCLNTNLSGSDAPIAQDLRRTVHRLLTQEGMSDAEIRSFLQERYGDFVLYDPPFKPATWILWIGPVVFGIAGLMVLLRLLRQPEAQPLDAEESARLEEILRKDST